MISKELEDFFQQYRNLCAQRFPQLEWKSWKRTKSMTWASFYIPGRSPDELVIDHKTQMGSVDLRFDHRAVDELSKMIEAVLDNDMKVVLTGKSASVRVVVPKLDPYGSLDPQFENALIGMGTADRLRRFVELHEPHLKTWPKVVT